MSEHQISEKTRQARDKLRQMLKENPELAKAFRETLDELRKPENVKAVARDICAGMAAIQKAMEYAKRGEPVGESSEV